MMVATGSERGREAERARGLTMRRASKSQGGDGRKRVGARGEEAAARYLEAHGLRVVERNYRCRWGEVDVVAVERDTIVFVEVKLRYEPFDPLEAVDERKQHQISKAAFDFLLRRGMLGRPARFDVVAVEGKSLECTHVEDAFESSLGY